MAIALNAPTGARRSLIPFAVKLRSPGRVIAYTALARSSGDVLQQALEHALPPFSCAVHPLALQSIVE